MRKIKQIKQFIQELCQEIDFTADDMEVFHKAAMSSTETITVLGVMIVLNTSSAFIGSFIMAEVFALYAIY